MKIGMCREAEQIMRDRFGKDNVLALATEENGVPYVRYVNAYYENGCFYVITYALSSKMKQIAQNPTVAITGEWFTAHGKGSSLGFIGKEENQEMAEKLKAVFASWIGNGHTNLQDENTILLRIELTDGLLLSHGTRYEFSPLGYGNEQTKDRGDQSMSKIIVLVGSVRREGNTELLARAFAEGAGKRHEVELVSVADYSVHPCLGCNRCFSTEGNQCVQKDDMGKIYEKLRQADTLIIASPVYFYGISAQLKALIDRLHTPMRNQFQIKRLGLILVGAATLPDLFDPILVQYRMILRFFGFQDVGQVLVRGARNPGDVLQGDGLKQAYDWGNALR